MAVESLDGPDGLSSLWQSLVDFATSDSPPSPVGNHARNFYQDGRLIGTGDDGNLVNKTNNEVLSLTTLGMQRSMRSHLA